MIFSSFAIEQQYRQYFAKSRFKYDIAASLLSTAASLSFAMKATASLPTHPDSSITFLFLLLVVSKSIPLLVILHAGREDYLKYRSQLMCTVSLLRVVPYLVFLTSSNVQQLPCEIVRALLGEALGGSLAVALSYQMLFNWHMPLHGAACFVVALALCTQLCTRAVPGTPNVCPDVAGAVMEAASAINYLVNVFVLPFAEWSSTTVHNPCVATTVMLLFNMGFLLPSCVLYSMEKSSRRSWALQMGLPAVPGAGMLGLWLFDPLPLVGSLVYANCGLWLYVRLFEKV